MIDRKRKEVKGFEVSLGLLVGYILAALINVVAFDKSIGEAFNSPFLLIALAGLIITAVKLYKIKKVC